MSATKIGAYYASGGDDRTAGTAAVTKDWEMKAYISTIGGVKLCAK
ncbi:hypothetical protein J2T14_001453 [Paenibacillus harenae]|nr:hypothetical protein [Paenibacillus harenae]